MAKLPFRGTPPAPRGVQFEDHDEAPHDPGPDPAWQESVFLHWFDPKVGIGGIHRIGHEPAAGITALWCGVVADDGTRFRRSVTIPYRVEDRLPDGFAAGPGQQLTYDPRPRLRVGRTAASSTCWSPTSTPGPTSSHPRRDALGGLRRPPLRGLWPGGRHRRRRRAATRSTASATGTTAGAPAGGTPSSPTGGCRGRSGRRFRSGRSPGTAPTAPSCGSGTSCATARSATPTWMSSSTWRPTGSPTGAGRSPGAPPTRARSPSAPGGRRRPVGPPGRRLRRHPVPGGPDGWWGPATSEISTNPRNGTGPVLTALLAVAEDGLTKRL